jgi:hypothetical protein
MPTTAIFRLVHPEPLRRTLAVVGVGALLSAGIVSASAGVVVATPAGFEQQTYTLSGALSIGAPPSLTLPAGSTFTATVDLATGAITDGHTSIPTFTRGPVSGPPANITLTDAAPATGTLDLVTGEATLNTSFHVSIEVPVLASTCSLGPVNVPVSTSGAGGSPLSGSPATGTLTASTFLVPAVVVSATCTQPNADLVNGALVLPNRETSISLTVVRVVVPPTPPTTKAPAPVPVAVQPAFTG